ncbi:hypothetical protein ACFWNE_07550 [Streptomyces goshikiensis]|uniref:hypothetical protein n=1 Tax=Streptomyces goshikiensis TaxID=1942 RepID=UPI0036555D1C
MAFPAGTPTITLVGKIPSAVAGTGYAGLIDCKPSAYLIDSTRHAVYPGGGKVDFATDGTFSVVLLPCDAAGIQPTGWLWHLDLQPSRGQRIQFYANITGTGTVHFDDLVPVPAPGGGPGAGGGAVSSVNGKAGAVELDAADVGADPQGTAAAAAAAHVAATDPHGDRAAAGAALAAHEADTTAVHGISNTAALETQAGAQSKADAAQAAAASSAATDATGKVSAHAAASDPHGDRAAAASALAAHEADTTSVHGIANTASLETQSGAQTKATAAQAAATTTAASALAAHEADSTDVHGIANTAALETTTGAQAKVNTHRDATDPHGDRTWATSQFYPLVSGTALDGYLGDLLTRVSAVEGGTAFLAALNVVGLTRIANAVLQVEGPASSVRHTLDGAANKIGFHGATPITRQTVSGSRADGTAAASLLSAMATLGLVTDSSTAGPAAPGWADRPADQNLLAWTYDPNMAGHVTAQSNSGVAGRITLVRIILREAITWSNIWIGLAGLDAGASLSNCYLGVYSAAGTLMGTTADISSSLMTGATAKALPLTTPFAAPAGTYFIAMLLNGTWATNSLTFKASGAGISANAGLTAPNLRYSNMLTSQTSLPSSLTLSGQLTSIINTGWASQWYGVS